MKLGVEIFFFKIPIVGTTFGFSSKTLKLKPLPWFLLILSENFKILRFLIFDAILFQRDLYLNFCPPPLSLIPSQSPTPPQPPYTAPVLFGLLALKYQTK